MKKTTQKATAKKSKNNALREKLYTIAIIMLIIIVCTATIIGICEMNFKFWNKSNELRIISEISIIDGDENEILGQDTAVTPNTDKVLQEKINTLKSGMSQFFKEVYNADITDKLDKIEQVYIFSHDQNVEDGYLLNGYYDWELNTINLNRLILDDTVLVDYVFVHETMHYLGIIDREVSGHYFIEGIADALTYQCLEFMGKEFDLNSSSYSTQTELAMQLLVVDKEIIASAVTQEDFDIMQKINDVLKDVPRTVSPCDNIAECLEICINSLHYSYASIEHALEISSDDIFLMKFTAQEIIASYCKEFSPSKTQIAEIRKHYIVNDFEAKNIVVEGDSRFVY